MSTQEPRQQAAPDMESETIVTDTRPTDDNEDASLDSPTQISLAIYINPNFEETNNVDSKQDIEKTVNIDPKQITISQLHKTIPTLFDNEQQLQSLWQNNDYEWKLYEYNKIKVGTEIANDTQLQKEIVDTMEGDEDEDNDMNKNDFYVRFRVVFHKSMCIYLCRRFFIRSYIVSILYNFGDLHRIKQRRETITFYTNYQYDQ